MKLLVKFYSQADDKFLEKIVDGYFDDSHEGLISFYTDDEEFIAAINQNDISMIERINDSE